MAGFRKPDCARAQQVIFAPSLDDSIPQDHPVRQFDALMRSRGIREVIDGWASAYKVGKGRPPYHPRDIASLYLYGMLIGIRSSRQLESSCFNRLDVRWLLSGLMPDHSTITIFVKRFGSDLSDLFAQVVLVGVESGVASLRHLAIDGTTIRANASLSSSYSKDSIKKKLAKLENEWAENEAAEAEIWGQEAPFAPSHGQSDQEREKNAAKEMVKLKRALKEIERREEAAANKSRLKSQASVVDPEARTMQGKDGVLGPNYNAQLAVDAESGFAIAASVDDSAHDAGHLIPVLDDAQGNAGRDPERVLADSGYTSGSDLAQLEDRGIEGFLPDSGSSKLGREEELTKVRSKLAQGTKLSDEEVASLPKRAGKFKTSCFVYDEQEDEYICPDGQRLPYFGTSPDKNHIKPVTRRSFGRIPACKDCQLRNQCTTSNRGRHVNRDEYEPYRDRHRQRMSAESAAETYKLRTSVERCIGRCKDRFGARQFLRRGRDKVAAEWTAIVTALNIAILIKNWEQVRPTIEME